jgi:type II secretory pathway component PulM
LTRIAEPIDQETVESFARRLDAFAAQLAPRDRAILAALIEAAAPALERIGRRPAEEILTSREQEALARLEREEP